MRPAVKVARIAGASRHSRLETEPTRYRNTLEIPFYKAVTGQRSFFIMTQRSETVEQSARTLKCFDALHKLKTSFRNILHDQF